MISNEHGSGSTPPPLLNVVVLMPVAEQRGGAERTLWHLLENGRNAGVRWLVIFQQEGTMATQVRALGVEVIVIPAGRLRDPYRFVASVARIARLARH